MEELRACVMLYVCGLLSGKAYVQTLDDLFMRDEANECLLELEFCTKDREKTLSVMNAFLGAIDRERFGRALMKKLEQVYRQEKTDLREFGKGTYRLWQMLPLNIGMENPLHILSYADDPLSWGDEKQSRELYESAFAFYPENGKDFL